MAIATMLASTLELARTALGFPRPEATDLWSFWLLAGLWMGILSTAWLVFRWLHHDDETTRGL